MPLVDILYKESKNFLTYQKLCQDIETPTDNQYRKPLVKGNKTIEKKLK